MTSENVLVLSILAGAVVLFVSEKLRVDVVAMIVLATLGLTGLVTPEEAFSGFSSPAGITVWAVFIVSGGLTRSGVADMIARRVVRGATEPLLLVQAGEVLKGRHYKVELTHWSASS